MAFDSSKPYGTSLGGKTHNMHVQNGKIYRADGAEVDESGNVVKSDEVKIVPPKAAAAEVKSELPAQVVAQMKQK